MKLELFGSLDEWRARIGDRDKVVAGSFTALTELIVPELIKNVGLGSAVGFRSNDEETALDIDPFSKRRNNVRIGRVKYEQLGKSLLLTKRSRQHFRAKRRATHPANHHVLKTTRMNRLGKLNQLIHHA